MAAKKIRVTAVEHLQRALENLPTCPVEEVSKRRAIGMLVPQIQNLQSKGYGWDAIAGLLCEGGIAVTAVTLKSYLQQAKAVGGKEAERKSKRSRGEKVVPLKARAEPRPAACAPLEGAPLRIPGGDRVASPSGTKGVHAPKSDAVAASPATAPSKSAARRPEPATSPRSAFLPKEDSEEI
jgi:hypothetical protein